MHEYTLIRSKRRTLSLQIGSSGELIARAPRWMPVFAIEAFIRAKSSWIEKNQKKMINDKGRMINYSEEDIVKMKGILKEYLDVRVQKLWQDQGLPKYTSLKVTKSERRWGSCSGKNGLCFSYRLAEYLPAFLSSSEPGSLPEKQKDTTVSSVSVTVSSRSDFIDAIIYHEIAHLREKHHGKRFWSLVYSMMPEYEDIMRDHRDFRD